MIEFLLFLILVELIGGKTLRHNLKKNRKWLLPVLLLAYIAFVVAYVR